MHQSWTLWKGSFYGSKTVTANKKEGCQDCSNPETDSQTQTLKGQPPASGSCSGPHNRRQAEGSWLGGLLVAQKPISVGVCALRLKPAIFGLPRGPGVRPVAAAEATRTRVLRGAQRPSGGDGAASAAGSPANRVRRILCPKRAESRAARPVRRPPANAALHFNQTSRGRLLREPQRSPRVRPAQGLMAPAWGSRAGHGGIWAESTALFTFRAERKVLKVCVFIYKYNLQYSNRAAPLLRSNS